MRTQDTSDPPLAVLGFAAVEPAEEPPALSTPTNRKPLQSPAAHTRAAASRVSRPSLSLQDPEAGLGELLIMLTAPGGQARTVVAKMRPLGMVFQKVPPFRVDSVEPEGHMQELGIEVGWEVKRVGAVDLRWLTLVEAEEDLAAVRQEIAQLPIRLPMVVQSPGGDCETVILTSSPIGMDFNPTPPFEITNVTALSLAEKLGVRKDWLVRRVGSVEMRERADLRPALAQFKLLPSG